MNEYKYLVKLTTKDTKNTIIIAKTNDIDECNRLAQQTKEWLKQFKQNQETKEFAESVIHVAAASEGACYIR